MRNIANIGKIYLLFSLSPCHKAALWAKGNKVTGKSGNKV